MTRVRSKREQRLLVVAVVVLAGVFVWVYYAYGLTPLFRKVVQLGQEIRTTNIKLQHIEQAIAQEPQLRQERDRLGETIQALSALLPPEEELPSVIELLSDVASQTGVKIQTIFPLRASETEEAPTGAKQPPDKGREFYTQIPIQIDALTGFHQLGSFLSHVESSPQPMQLKSLRISGDPKEPRRHNMKIVLTVYFAASSSGS